MPSSGLALLPVLSPSQRRDLLRHCDFQLYGTISFWVHTLQAKFLTVDGQSKESMSNITSYWGSRHLQAMKACEVALLTSETLLQDARDWAQQSQLEGRDPMYGTSEQGYTIDVCACVIACTAVLDMKIHCICIYMYTDIYIYIYMYECMYVCMYVGR